MYVRHLQLTIEYTYKHSGSRLTTSRTTGCNIRRSITKGTTLGN